MRPFLLFVFCSAGSTSILPHQLPVLFPRGLSEGTRSHIAAPPSPINILKPTAMLKSSQISSTSIILQQIQVLNPTASGPKFSILSNPSIIAQERKALKPTTTAPNSIKVSNSVTTPTSGFVQKALSQGNHVRGLNLELGNYSADIFGEAYVGPQKYSNQSLAYSPPPHEHLLARGDTYLTASPASTQWQNFPNGYGQWDDQHKDMVIRAWNIAKIMTAAVLASMQAIGSGSPNYQLFTETNPICKNTKAATAEFYNCYRTFIAQSNLAYGQLFGADPENIGLSESKLLR